jgi:hypothetical protein
MAMPGSIIVHPLRAKRVGVLAIDWFNQKLETTALWRMHEQASPHQTLSLDLPCYTKPGCCG